jgi:hypothetical protein
VLAFQQRDVCVALPQPRDLDELGVSQRRTQTFRELSREFDRSAGHRHEPSRDLCFPQAYTVHHPPPQRDSGTCKPPVGRVVVRRRRGAAVRCCRGRHGRSIL